MFKRTTVSGAALLALCSLAATAQAQTQAPTTIERVEVTGSRIRTIDAETAQPVQTVSAAQIKASGLVTVGDILNTLSSAGTPAFSKGSVLTSNREMGGQYIDMRNLGSQRLLILVNGKRWTTTIAGYTDISTIPSALIDRMEILKDGASSTYGSDAIAGVVNIILRKNMEGGELSVYTGQNSKGDGKTQDVSIAYGAGNDKGNVMFGLTYSDQGVVWAKDRVETATTYGPNYPTTGFGASPWGRLRDINASGGATGRNIILNHTGGPLGDGTGSDSRNPANYHNYAGAPEDTFNSTSQMMFQAPTRLTTLFTRGTLELPKDIRFSSTAMFANRDSSAQVAGYPFNSLSQTSYPVYLSKDSYYNPFGNQVAGAGLGKDMFVYRRTIEVPRVTENTNKTTHIDAALDGDFTLLNKPWSWSVGVNYNDVAGSVLSTGNLNLLNMKQALGPSFMNASGVVQCGTPAAPIDMASCVPFDIVGGPSASTQKALNYVMSVGQATYGSTVRSYNADVTGELFALSGGNAALATGIEYRTVSGYDRPGQFEQSGFSTNLAGNPTVGNYSVKEAYGELNLPLLKGVKFAELLTVNLATRYSDYSNFGSTTNSKGSFMWKPVRDVLVRGTVAQGFRAPTVSDNFGGGSQTFDSYLDPCDTKYGSAATTAATAANCAKAGVPAGFRQVDQAGKPVAAAAQSPYAFYSGAGNNNVQPETAKTKTAGILYSPASVSGLTMGLDWFSIEIDNKITAISTTYILNQCYVQGVSSFCSSIKRDPISGMITTLARGNGNLGKTATDGVDLSLSYDLPKASWGQLKFKGDATYVNKFSTKSTDTADWINYAGEYGIPRVKANYSFTWERAAYSARLAGRYIGAQKTDCVDVTNQIECNRPTGNWSGGTGYDLKGSTTYFDLTLGYKTSWKGDISVGVQNVFNKAPRINRDANSNYGGASSSSSVDPNLPLDRFLWVRYGQAF